MRSRGASYCQNKKSRVPTGCGSLISRSAKMTSLSGVTQERADNVFSQRWTYYISLERKFNADQKSLTTPARKWNPGVLAGDKVVISFNSTQLRFMILGYKFTRLMGLVISFFTFLILIRFFELGLFLWFHNLFNSVIKSTTALLATTYLLCFIFV